MGKNKKNYLSVRSFPNSLHEPFEITSPETANYNCLAWAMKDNSKWIECDEDYFWFDGIPRDNKLSTIISIFEKKGFQQTKNIEYEDNTELVALFTKDNIECSHLARQIGHQLWTSKLGSSFDVNHSLRSIERGIYGNAVIFVKKEREVEG